MQCAYCGNELKDGSKFCGVCGHKVEDVAQAPKATPESTPTPAAASTQASEPVPVAAPAPAQTAAPTPTQATSAPAQTTAPTPAQAAPSPAQATAPTPAPSSAPNPQPQQVVPAQPQGCLGAAWRDITSSPNWLKRILLLMVMKCVPILGFYVDGYALNWASDAAHGKNNVLPAGNFTKHTFLKGVLYAVLNILFAIASVWTFVLNLIPFVGFIALFVVGLFANAFFALAAVRMAIKDKFGDAFDLSEIFAKYKKRVGSLIGATFVPSLIVGVIFMIIALIIIGIATFSAVSSISSVANSMYGGYGYMMGSGSAHNAYGALSALGSLGEMTSNPVGFIMGLVTALGAILFVLVLIYMFLAAFAEIWSLRAVGRWVEVNARDWVDDMNAPDTEKVS